MLEDEGMSGEGLKSKPSKFAQWRWSTMKMVLSWMAGLLSAYSYLGTQEDTFRRTKNPGMIKSVFEIFRSPVWYNRFRVIWDLASWLGAKRKWGSGCECHEVITKNRVLGYLNGNRHMIVFE